LLDSGTEELEHAWKKQQRERIKDAETDVVEATGTVKHYIAEAAKAKLGAVKYRSLHERAQGLQGLVARYSATKSGLVHDINALERKDYKKCPTCGAPVSNAHIKKEIAKNKQQVAEVEALLADTKDKCRRAEADAEAFADEEENYLNLERTLSAHKADLESTKRQLAERKAEANPYTAQREEMERRGQELSDKLLRVQADISLLTAQTGAAQYWVKGFKEIRLMLIQESLAQLTLECNEVLFQMGLQDWSVSFDVERETKAGGINKNFTVMVQAPQMKDPVPWEVWSGGESQRLRLAVSMGCANLVSGRLGMQPTVEMWDEPSSWMAEAGIQDMLSVLTERAQRYQKVILLADHRALDFGGFAGIINIVKDSGGSRIDVGIVQ